MKKVLFITTILPDYQGSGRAKRAHQWVKKLQENSQLSLLYITRNHWTPDPLISFPFEIQTVDARLSLFQKLTNLLTFLLFLFSKRPAGLNRLYWISMGQEQRHHLTSLFAKKSFDRVVCFRLHPSDYALFLKKQVSISSLELDMDDIESLTWKKIGRLLWKNRRYRKAIENFAISLQFQLNEKKIIKYFDRIYCCSEEDKQYFTTHHHTGKVAVFPNRIWQITPLPEGTKGRLDLLFTGTLSYYPNEEAIRWFLTHVFGKLRKEYPHVIFHVAGFDASSALSMFLQSQPGVIFHGRISDIRTFYMQGDVFISPLHAGGGTKLKIIEAMALRLPVIATGESVYGLGLTPGTHFLLAEEPEEFIKHYHNLYHDPQLRRDISLAGNRTIKEIFGYE